tara:strand:+ start:409 stop:600 length:192 start_codon:yes stop_codon:yes gene_type:complete
VDRFETLKQRRAELAATMATMHVRPLPVATRGVGGWDEAAKHSGAPARHSDPAVLHGQRAGGL